MSAPKLFMILLGCKPPGRHTEQHDIFFSIGETLGEIKNDMLGFWKEAEGKIHVDAWREVRCVDGYEIEIKAAAEVNTRPTEKLFFINLGGYKRNEFEEFHYKLLNVATEKGAAIKAAKQTAFYRHTGFEGATSHIDDKYGIDVDDVYEIEDILPSHLKEQYAIIISPKAQAKEDELHLGYLKLDKI